MAKHSTKARSKPKIGVAHIEATLDVVQSHLDDIRSALPMLAQRTKKKPGPPKPPKPPKPAVGCRPRPSRPDCDPVGKPSLAGCGDGRKVKPGKMSR